MSIGGGSWRIPTKEEWTELKDNSIWTWTTINGVNGYKITSAKTGYTDNSIFLPAAGYRSDDNLIERGFEVDYWSSSLASLAYGYNIVYAYSVLFSSSGRMPTSSTSRCNGLSVRPVCTKEDKPQPAAVTGVSVSPESIIVKIGKKKNLTVTVLPKDAANKNIRFSSSDESVATVTQDGIVEGIALGDAIVTVTTEDGNFKTQCEVTVMKNVFPEGSVDLGLSVAWASCNVGATKPEDYGGYYQWAGTSDVTSTSIFLDWSNCPYHTGSNSSSGWTKYNINLSYGTVDNKTVLELSDDVAHTNWGGSWRMPTYSDWDELSMNCSWTWTTVNGINGYKVTSKKSGYTDKSIFLPASGSRSEGDFYNRGSDCGYWCSTLLAMYPWYAWSFHFNPDGTCGYGSGNRYSGLPVRPVSD